jgi:hypothetical protein
VPGGFDHIPFLSPPLLYKTAGPVGRKISGIFYLLSETPFFGTWHFVSAGVSVSAEVLPELLRERAD